MKRALVLAVETSGRQGGVALGANGGVLATRNLPTERPYTSGLLPVVAEMLREAGKRPADVGVFCYSCGPGSFTGLRVAATVGRMLQSTIGCEVVAVSTLEVIARNLLSHPERPRRIAAVLDAQRGEVYAAAFERAGDEDLKRLSDDGIHDPSAWLASLTPPFWITGEGVERHRAACESSGGCIVEPEFWRPSAEEVLEIGARLAAEARFCRPEEIVPKYIRPPACEEVYEQRRAEARRRRGE